MIDIFKIGEFSKLTQVTIRMLRYYDETGLLKPAKINEYTGYRLYSVEQIPILNKIIFLRDVGFNVSEIAIALDKWENKTIAQKLELKKDEINLNIKKEEEKLGKILQAVTNIDGKKFAIDYSVIIKNIPSVKVISLRKTIENYSAEGLLWKEMSELIEVNDIKLQREELNFALYHDEEYKEENVDVEICVVTNKLGENKAGLTYREVEEVKTMACMMVYGPYESLNEPYFAFADWLTKHKKYKMANKPNRQICHRGPWNEDEPSKYLTEIQIAVE